MAVRHFASRYQRTVSSACGLPNISSFHPMAAKAPNASVYVKRRNQWPGTGEVGTPELTQLVAAKAARMVPMHALWRENGAKLLDKIEPAIVMTHSAGGPFGWLVAEIRPNLVKAIVVIEEPADPLRRQQVGLTDVPWRTTRRLPIPHRSRRRRNLV
jgi:pimeloyl-ACP methyl ester carboxylesterase